jgi:ribulose-phosphate 3-epimerase
MKHRVAIEPSILSADFALLGPQAKEAEHAGVEGIQIDVMDGHFVPNITFGPGVVKALRKTVSMFLDAHLMIDNPERFLEEFAHAGANRIIVHQEACSDLLRVVERMKGLRVEAGVAVNPATPLTSIDEILGTVDCVQVMTVNPGFAGQRFMEDQLVKIQQLRRELDQRHFKAAIVVDGGVDLRTAPMAVKSGATVLVAGSSIYNESNSVAQNVAALRRSMEPEILPVNE